MLTVQASSLGRAPRLSANDFWQTSEFNERSHPGAGPDIESSAAEIFAKDGSQAATAVAREAMEDFRSRCLAPGVVYCQGFDNPSGFEQNVNIFANGTYPNVFPKKDTSTGRSGSSLRIDIPPKQGANSGKFYATFPGVGGPDTNFYFQVATRISPEMLSNFANPAAQWPTWKNHAFFNGNTSCTGMGVVTGLSSDGVIPIATANCGSNGYFTNGGVPPYLMQQGDYKCPYRGENRRSCFYWPADTWVTFYYYVHLGTYNIVTDAYDNTSVDAWIAVDGGAYKQWVKISGWAMGANGKGKWDHVELYPYMTGKDDTTTYPTGHVWFDELIISTKPIAAPAVPPALP
jgi:hypothetical protein